jgi:hypothetical protein
MDQPKGGRTAKKGPEALAAAIRASRVASAAQELRGSKALLSAAAWASHQGERISVAGRALQKHQFRPGTVYPKPFGTPEQINAQAGAIVDDILANESRRMMRYVPRLNGMVVDIFDSTGRGIRFRQEQGTFVGFLEP